MVPMSSSLGMLAFVADTTTLLGALTQPSLIDKRVHLSGTYTAFGSTTLHAVPPRNNELRPPHSSKEHSMEL